jgi:nucleotidyltransferase-like protein
VYDAVRAGFRKVVLVIRREVEDQIRRHVAAIINGGVDVAYARQVLELPPAVPGRAKPWGTGHAVLTAASEIAGPFAVMNADDLYGASAYQMLREYLSKAPAGDHALVGYSLRETLSPHGGVSRAVAETDTRGYLSRLAEVTGIESRGAVLMGRAMSGQVVTLGGHELVSMNLWGFTAAVLPGLQRQFDRFVETHGSDPRAEFLLSEAMGAQVVAGEARVRVLETRERWVGMTFAADDEVVRAEVARLVHAGLYPANLRSGFEGLACD